MRSAIRTCTFLARGAAPAHQSCATPLRSCVIALAAAASFGLASSRALADISPTVTVGAGVRASFDTTDPDDPGAKKVEDFNLDSIRLYVSGSVTDQIAFMFNTEYKGSPPAGDNSVQVLDAAAQFHFSDEINIWAGRFLPPSDRANLYGPYYSNQWAVYNDGVQDGYPSVATGRDNGVMYWGQFGMLKASAGAFDVPSTVGTSNKVYAARLQLDLWDPEKGYYLNGTYYGDKDLLAFGVAGQDSDSNKAYSGDFLLEKKLDATGGGVVSVEAEYAKYENFGGYSPLAADSDGWYGLASYLFPQVIGIGKFQILAKFAHAKYELDTGVVPDDTQKTKDIELNYVIKQFNARLSLYYLDFTYDHQIVATDHKQYGLGVQLQM
jgi:hypothetical protein